MRFEESIIFASTILLPLCNYKIEFASFERGKSFVDDGEKPEDRQFFIYVVMNCIFHLLNYEHLL